MLCQLSIQNIALIDALSMLDGANLMERMNADEAD